MSTQNQTLEFKPLSRITVAMIGGKPKEAIKQDSQVFVGRFFGEAHQHFSKELKSGGFMNYLIGEFRAVNPEGGKFQSSKLAVAESILEPIQAMLRTSDGNPVQFAFDLYANPSEKSPVGYDYAMKPLVETEAANRIEKMTAMLMNGQQLSAPITRAQLAAPSGTGPIVDTTATSAEPAAKKGRK